MCIWEWNISGLVLFLHYFLPCVTLPHVHAHVQITLLPFTLHLFLFHLQWPYLSQLKCEYQFLRTVPKSTSVSSVSSSSTLGIPTVTLHGEKHLLLGESVLRWNCITPAGNSELRLKSCILRSWDSGFAPKSLHGHSEKRNGLKDQKYSHKWVDAWCSPGSVFFKCCCVLSGRKKNNTQKQKKIHWVRWTKFLWVQYMPCSGN